MLRQRQNVHTHLYNRLSANYNQLLEVNALRKNQCSMCSLRNEKGNIIDIRTNDIDTVDAQSNTANEEEM